MSSQVPAGPDPKLAQQIANTIRFLSADGVEKAGSGHPGLPMGCADIATVLFTRFMTIDPDDPSWIDRDRFILSAGHGSMLLYTLLYFAGYLTLEDLQNFRQTDSRTPGHPEHGDVPGVDMTAGPLAAGFAAGVGMTLAEAMMRDMYATPKYEVVDHHTYVLMSDGCNMEGLSNEAASLAGHLKLGRLIAIYDDNEISIEGSTDLAFTENVNARYEALGWHVQDIDGHDHEAIAAAIQAAKQERTRPSLIVAHTTIGKGAPEKAGTAESHGAPLGEAELRAAKEAMGWPTEMFHVPAEVTAYWESKKTEWRGARKEWDALFAKFEKDHKALAKEMTRVVKGELPKQWKHALPTYEAGKEIATRNAGGEIMNAFGEIIPELVGGSADLEPSTKTHIKTGEYADFIAPNMFLGRNIHFGVREHAMGQIVNGLALHGGFIPFGSTFMVFHDYMRAAVRMSAIMRQHCVWVYTHDSIFVGEDGPTHQPVEHLAALRCIPRLHVVRPCDANETAWAWQYALDRSDAPTALALTRQKVPVLDRTEMAEPKGLLKGGYILQDALEGQAEILLCASGSEVHVAVEVANILREAGRTVRIVSMPCLDLFKEQSEGYRRKLFPKRFKKRAIIEAGVVQGWEGILGDSGVFIGLDDFGRSGPYKELAIKYGFTADAILDRLAEADF